VQGALEQALARISGRAVPLAVAGRTDSGVHAWAQVASYPGDPVPPRALNAVLPDALAVLAAESVPDGWDARGDATSRAYCYRVLTRTARSVWERGRALWHPRPLDLGVLHRCAAALPGEHDFIAFTPTETQHVRFRRRVLAARWTRNGDVLEFWIEADAFMRHMNRILVGTMLECAAGGRDVAGFPALLEGSPRSEAGRTAPPHGLYFAGAGYAGETVLAP
jgi:tRNA pseudouridine38-40 synthase